MNRRPLLVSLAISLMCLTACERSYTLDEIFGGAKKSTAATTQPAPVAAAPSSPASSRPMTPAPAATAPPATLIPAATATPAAPAPMAPATPPPVTPIPVQPVPPSAAAAPAPTPTQAQAPTPAPSAAAIAVDPALPDYVPQTRLDGRMRSIGSDTLDKVMSRWQAEFKKFHPDLDTKLEAKGSGTAVPALLDNQSDFGPMSRTLSDVESKTFYSRKTYPLLQVRIAVDSLAIFVHPSNPIARTGMDLRQLDSIFSASHKRGGQDLTTWGQLGLEGDWASKPIDVFSRNKASGTYAFFREHVLLKGDYRSGNHEMVGSEMVVESIEKNLGAIGYSGIGYKTPGVVTVPLSMEPGGKVFPATAQYAYSGQYPLSRFLYIAVDQKKGDQVSPLKREFFRFVYSKQGQQIVADEGYYPIPASIAREELNKLGFSPDAAAPQ